VPAEATLSPLHAKPVLSCCNCKKKVNFADELLLHFDAEGKSSNWCGKLWGVCQECSGMDPTAFKKATRKAWHKRRGERGVASQKARTITWNTIAAEVLEHFPGIGAKEKRELSLLRLRAGAQRWQVDFQQRSEQSKVAARQVCQTYLENLEKMARSVEEPLRHEALQFTATEAEYFTKVSENICISFLCRRKECLFFGRNDMWIKEADHRHFRCPLCGMRYQPWVEKMGWVKASKVLMLEDPIGGTSVVLPCSWPQTAEDNWIMQQTELFAKTVAKPEWTAQQYLNDSSLRLHDLLARVGSPMAFQRFELRDEVVNLIMTCSGYGLESVEQLRGGFDGQRLPLRLTEPVFTDWDLLVSLLANMSLATQACL
jgi:hypothetical protein